MLPQFIVDMPGGGGKRLVSTYESYNRTTGVSKYARRERERGREEEREGPLGGSCFPSIGRFMLPQFIVDMPGGGGKRLVSTYESYDRMTGVSKYVEEGGGEGGRGGEGEREREGERGGPIGGFMLPQFMVDMPGGGGKRLVSTYESYNRTTGVSKYVEEGGGGRGRGEERGGL